MSKPSTGRLLITPSASEGRTADMTCAEDEASRATPSRATVLVVGAGAENPEDQLGAVVNRLALGQDLVRVIGFDHQAAAHSCDHDGPDFVLGWMVRQESPALIVVVEDGDDQPVGVDALAVSSVRIGRTPGLEALDAWWSVLSAKTTTAASSVSDGAAETLLTALSALSPLADPLAARDRSPRVSEVICVYNQERFLHETMRSMLASTYDDYEVVVIDDGSTDASAGIIEQYLGHPRVRLVSHENLGHTGRMDLVWARGLRAARGDLIAFLGGDDKDLPHRLTAQVSAFDEDPALGVCHSASWLIDETSQRLGTGIALQTPYDDLSFLRLMLRGSHVGHPTVMMSRDTLRTHGLLEDGIASDIHYWYKSGGRARFRYLPQRLVEYRVHGNALSTTEAGSIRCAESAHRSRRLVFSRRSLVDFYPELVGAPNPRVWADAALEIGNVLATTGEPHLALRLYAEAYDMSQDPRLLHNRAVLLTGLGDFSTALRIAESLTAVYPDSAELAAGIRAGTRFDASLFREGPGLAPAIASGRWRNGEDARNWDGSPVRSRSAYVAVAPFAAGLTATLLDAWSLATERDPQLRWVYPDLGSDTIDLRTPDGVRLEKVDDLAILPPDERRWTGVIRAAHDVKALQGWMAVPA